MGSFGTVRSRSLVWALMFVLGCGSGGSGGTGTGGSQSTGGATGSGGASATGGSHGSGGANGTGGVSATGGSLGTGGASATGGSSGTGGAHATGGASATGGSVGAGGAAGKGAAGGSGTGGAGSGGLGGVAGGGHGGASSGTGGTSATGGASGSTGATDGGALPGWVLTWSDEFNGPDGSAVDSTKWVYDTGGGGWGNNELETYTSGTANAVIQGGNLVITAASAGASSYTSARLKTLGKFSQQYGRFEARIQIPEGQGLWPAFWMMGADINTVSWPSCGEIDVMENIGKEPSINHGSLHMPATGGTTDDQLTGMYTAPGGAKLGDSFHTYAVEWTSSTITFYVDDMLYETQTQQGATGRTWEFNKPFFILLNVAVGGTWPGSPDSTTTFPQTMKVDWVRAYQPAN
jgi:beta-glucanase (GH16 family)